MTTFTAPRTDSARTLTAPARLLPWRRRGLLLALLPELALGLLLFDMCRQQLHTQLRADNDRDRGIGVVEWVLLIAIGAAMALTVGTIVYDKLKTKANSITTDTPAPGQ